MKDAPEGNKARRTFLKGSAAAAGAAIAATTKLAQAAEPAGNQPAAAVEKKLPAKPSSRAPGSDFMADVLKTIGLQYMAINPAAGFRSLHESILNYSGNKNPEIITCLHEETATHMAQGYAKASGKRWASWCTVPSGSSTPPMALYNAWVDRVPPHHVPRAAASTPTDAPPRSSRLIHSVQDPAAMVREFIKCGTTRPGSTAAALRGIDGARLTRSRMAAPLEAGHDCLDMDLQERSDTQHRPSCRFPTVHARVSAPGCPHRLLKEATSEDAGRRGTPGHKADRAVRSAQGLKLMVELAEALGAPVVDVGTRTNFPNTHDLECSFLRQTLLRDADVILLLEVNEPGAT
jgi:acetolactate synthase-1/2/3 large subunit